MLRLPQPPLDRASKQAVRLAPGGRRHRVGGNLSGSQEALNKIRGRREESVLPTPIRMVVATEAEMVRKEAFLILPPLKFAFLP